MIRLKQIIQKVVEHFQFIVMDDYDTELLIHQVEIVSAKTIYDENTLYLSDTVPVHPLPAADTVCYLMTAEPDPSPFLPIRITKQPPARELYCFIHGLLKLEALIENQSNRLYHVLYRGKGLKDVVALAESFFGYPISVCDASYNMIETSPLMRKMTYGLEQSQSRIYLADVEVESLKRTQVVEQIYRSSSAFSVRTVDHPDNLWVFCGIRIQNVMTGYVAVCMGDMEATDYILRMTTILADICSIEMQKHDFFITRTGMKYENFLIDLLEGRFTDVNMISSRLELLDRKFCKFFCLIVLSCTEPHNSDLFNKRQMTALRASYPNSMSVVYQDNVVLFLNQNEPIRLSEAFTGKLLEFSQLNHMKAGISQPFVDILKIHDFYLQAVNALQLGEQAQPNAILHFASDLLPQYLFQNAAAVGLSVGIHHHIYHLQGYDQEFHTEFIPTLRAYLDHDRNATKAAAALHIHRSTFFYRIKKIEELLEISITDSHLLFLYELSFMIWDYLC
ncbi:MAG: hypothetical protein HFI76_07825 [Lachnospiraceae bacterium]|nr:hypothetical protein [Lachnospiraceae bacterium]